MKNYNFEFRFYQTAFDKAPAAACACCFSGLPEGVTEAQLKNEMGKALTNCFNQVHEEQKDTDMSTIMTTATQMVAKEFGCCGFMLDMNSTSNFVLSEGRFT